MDFSIVYFASVGQNYGGVEQKIIAQFDALVKQRSNVVLYLICSFSPNGALALEVNKRPNIKLLVNTLSKVKNPFYRRKEKFQLISNVLKNYDPGETLIYFRYPDADFQFLDFLKANKGYKIVTEHQEIENTFRKFKIRVNYLDNLLESIYGRNVRRRIHAFVGVTSEITDFEIKASGEPKKNRITIGNGIDVQNYPIRILNTEHPEIIKILFVGSGYPRHGLDRIIKGISNYVDSGETRYGIVLRIAGDSNQMKDNKNLVKKLRIEEYVEFLGDRNSQELNEHFNWADIGAGSLAFHRIGLKYTSNLKAREYFSRGIPFFASTIDEDLILASKYVLSVDPNDYPINVKDIVTFALKVRSDLEHPKIMRDFATTHLDWNIKMKQLIIFLESLFSGSN